MKHGLICLALVAATGGCRQAETFDQDEAPTANDIAALEAQANAGQTIEPRQPGGLPDGTNLVAEGPIDPKSAQGAGQVLQSYAALLEQRRFAEARRLWSDGGRSSELSEEGFAEAYGKYTELHAEIGAPGPMEGAAGSAYVDIPLRFYGRLRDGRPVNSVGTATLRRVNDVPGSTEEQRQWRIYRMEMQPPP
jgi:hypothetical protein